MRVSTLHPPPQLIPYRHQRQQAVANGPPCQNDSNGSGNTRSTGACLSMSTLLLLRIAPGSVIVYFALYSYTKYAYCTYLETLPLGGGKYIIQ